MNTDHRWGVRVLGTGSYLPERVLTNHDLERMVDTTDEWITTRTGIKERRIAAPEQATSDLAVQAALAALADAKLSPEVLDLILVATVTPDMLFPSVACLVQQAIGATQAACFDINAACSGFIYGLAGAKGFLESGAYRTVLLIGAEKLSSITNWEDRSTCVLFGDGAGAVILGRTEEPTQLLSTYLGADGRRAGVLKAPGGGSRLPLTTEVVQQRLHCIQMDGQEVFKLAVTKMLEAAEKALVLAGKTYHDVTLFIPHQANLRIIEAIAKRLQVPRDRVFLNLDKYGNVSSATTVIALDEARRAGRIHPGDVIELVAFGGGLTWAAAVFQW